MLEVLDRRLIRRIEGGGYTVYHNGKRFSFYFQIRVQAAKPHSFNGEHCLYVLWLVKYKHQVPGSVDAFEGFYPGWVTGDGDPYDRIDTGC